MTEEQEASGTPAPKPAEPAGGPSATPRSRALNEMPTGPPGEPRARTSGPGKAYSPGGPMLDNGGPLSEDEIGTVEEALELLKQLREQVQDAAPTRTSSSTGQASIQDN